MNAKKKLVFGKLLALLLAPAAFGAVGDVTLSWQYDPAEAPGVTFHIYGTNNLSIPVAQWPLLKSVTGPITNATVRIDPGQFFFVCTASNLWGQSPPSNVASVPPLPKSPVTKIEAAN